MSIINLHEFKVEDSLLTSGGYCLEVGMRSMGLANETLARGMKHIAVEPDLSIFFPSTQDFKFHNEAIVGNEDIDEVELLVFRDSFCNHLSNISFPFSQTVSGDEMVKHRVKATTIAKLMQRYNIKQLDLLTMDCEGSEEDIILAMTKPVAKQIAVEFHTHVGQPILSRDNQIIYLESLGYTMVDFHTHANSVQYGLFVL